MAPQQTDGRFVQFVSLEYGYRAAIRNLWTYQKRYNLRSISQMISKWAPPTENNTSSYIATVAKLSGYAAAKPINMFDKTVCVNVVAAMSFVENGVKADKDCVGRAFDLAMKG